MYSLEPKKLLKALSGCHMKMAYVRWCLDFLYIKGKHTIELKEVQKAWPFETSIDDAKIWEAPQYLTIKQVGNNTEVYSRILKRHIEQQRILDALGQQVDIDTVSVMDKVKKSHLNEGAEVFCDREGKAAKGYFGLIPTRGYDNSKEVFQVQPSFYRALCDKYPDKNINEELEKIYTFFMSNPNSRRSPHRLKKYIECWIGDELVALNRLKKKREQVSFDDFYRNFLND